MLSWDDYLAWLAGKKTTATITGRRVPLAPPWKPGQHAALIGPTGEGKSTHSVGMMGLRKWVVALDPKGEDETLQASGYERVLKMPPGGGRTGAYGNGWKRVNRSGWSWGSSPAPMTRIGPCIS